jgi:hypothetical protein
MVHFTTPFSKWWLFAIDSKGIWQLYYGALTLFCDSYHFLSNLWFLKDCARSCCMSRMGNLP